MKKNLSILFLCVCFFACQQKVEPTHEKISIKGNFDLVTKNINAGEPVSISGTIDISSNEIPNALLVLNHSLHTKSYPIKLNGNKFTVLVPGNHNENSGQVICRLLCNEKLIDKEKFMIKPLNAINKMESFNGPKSLFANDANGSMNVSIPHDKYGNPMMSPSKVKYQTSYNGQIEKSEEKDISHLLSYQINSSKKQEGKYLIGSSVNEGFSQEQELIIGASMPVDFTIKLIDHYPYADSRQLMHLKTSVLKDKWGNVVADGTIVLFNIMEEGEMIGSYQSITIGGIANVYIENPSVAVRWKITAGLYDQLTSNEIEVNFNKNVADFPVEWNNKTNSLIIGPVVGILGQLAPNGTEVKISAIDSELEDFIFLEDGKVNYKISFDWIERQAKAFEVLIGGHLKTIDID